MGGNGSTTATSGFNNEEDIVKKFNNWNEDADAKEWLEKMGYDLNEIEKVEATRLKNKKGKGKSKINLKSKTDIEVNITIKTKTGELSNKENIQAKLIHGEDGYNQIERGDVDRYEKMWNISREVVHLLKLYTGEEAPYKKYVRIPGRMLATEFAGDEQDLLVDFFKKNKDEVLSDVIKGKVKVESGHKAISEDLYEDHPVKWYLVTKKNDDAVSWTLQPIDKVIEHYKDGPVSISNYGNIYIGGVTLQRKGGDNGNDSAKNLQFKIHPGELFQLESEWRK